MCFSRRPVGRRKCEEEVGEAGTKPKKLRAVIMKVGKKKECETSWILLELDVCWQNLKGKRKKKTVNESDGGNVPILK